MAHLDELSEDARIIGAVNTVIFKNGKLYGDNTDGKGGLDALEEKGPVRGKRMIILGAGGTARALAYEGLKRGAQITLVNRTIERAKKASKELGCTGYGFDDFAQILHEKYDILVNATSVGMLSDQSILDPKWIQPSTLVMEVISIPSMTPLLKDAEKKNCSLILGRELFLNQAAHQFALWFESKLTFTSAKEKIRRKLNKLFNK